MIVARHPNENGYVECKISAYQTRNLNFAIDTIRNFLKNEDDQAVIVLDSQYVDIPSQSSPYQNLPQYGQPHLSLPNQYIEHGQPNSFSVNFYQPQQQQHAQLSNTSCDSSQKNKEFSKYSYISNSE